MAIKLYTGIQGSGKSYEVVTVVILGALREGRRIVSNIAGLNFDAMRALLIDEGCLPEVIGSILQVEHEDVEKPNFWRNDTDSQTDSETIIQPGDVVILDEIWRFWESRSSVTMRQQNFFRMHRHMVHPTLGFTCEVVLITQDVSDVCTKIRAVVEKTFVMTKHTELGSDKHYRVDVYSRAKITGRTAPLNSFQRRYNPNYFKLYKSHSTNDGDIQAKEKSIDKRGNIWQKPIIKFGVPLSILVFGSSFYFLWKFFHPVEVVRPEIASSVISANAVASQQAITHESSVPVVSVSWRVLGWFYSGDSLVVSLQGEAGNTRFIHNPPTFKIEGRDLTVLLPEGGFATSYSGNFQAVQHGLIK